MQNERYEHSPQSGNQGNLPEKKFSTGAVVATVWKNASTPKQGQTMSNEYYTVSLQRRYMDTKGVWHSANSLRVNDLPKAALVLQKAYEYLVLKGQDQQMTHVDVSNAMPVEEVVM